MNEFNREMWRTIGRLVGLYLFMTLAAGLIFFGIANVVRVLAEVSWKDAIFWCVVGYVISDQAGYGFKSYLDRKKTERAEALLDKVRRAKERSE